MPSDIAPSILELNENQRRQLLDAEGLFDALEVAQEESWRHRGSMFWREQSGRNYLIKLSPDSKQRSLGPESEETQKTYASFMKRKEEAQTRLKDLREQAEVAKRMNRALRVGRTPDLLVDVLNTLAKARVSQHFLVVGTNALYAYETAAGVRFPNDVLETRDADFLYDTRHRANFLQVMADEGTSFLDLLRKVDKTFERHPTENSTAVNSKGYEVDVIRRFPPPELEESEHPLQMTPNDEDLWAVRASTAQRLLSVPKFSQVVVGTSGAMARMPTVHPMAFARIKRQLSQDPKRDPRKAPKDRAQADIVELLVPQFLPQLAVEPTTEDEVRNVPEAPPPGQAKRGRPAR
jgi:hypothetical protein